MPSEPCAELKQESRVARAVESLRQNAKEWTGWARSHELRHPFDPNEDTAKLRSQSPR